VENFKKSNLKFLRAFRRAPCDQLFRKTKLTIATPLPYDLDDLAVPEDIPSLPAVDPPAPQPRPRPGKEKKFPLSLSLPGQLSPSRPTVADAITPCQDTCMSTAVLSHTPMRQQPSPEPLCLGFSPPRPSFGTSSPALSRAYKRTQSMPRSSTPSPLSIPALLSSSPSWKRPSSTNPSCRALGVSGRHWSHRRCEVKESSRRRHSASPPSSSASSPSSAVGS
jgi:hypothetical protein